MIRLAAILLFAALLVTGGVSLIPADAQAQAPKLLMKKKANWNAYRLKESKGPACYMTAQPTKSLPKNVKRGEIWFLVTHRPKRRITNEVSNYIGYPFKTGSEVTVVIDDKKRFSLFTDGNIAWGDGARQEARLVAAMKKGGEMVVRGISKRGTKTTDTYSLKGFTAAYRAISKSCGVR